MGRKNIAFVNIALLKYWGKIFKDDDFYPSTNSISVRVKKFNTTTKIEKSKDGNNYFYINNKLQSDEELSKVLSIIQNNVEMKEAIVIRSYSKVPFKAGLASSASGMAALILAINHYYRKNWRMTEVIQRARKASGSSCRSFYPYAAWTKDNRVFEIKTKLKISFIVLVCDLNQKILSSRKGMELAQKSVSYQEFLQHSEQNYPLMLQAFQDADLSVIGEIAEQNCLLMHQTIIEQGINYLNDLSYQAIEVVKQIRRESGLKVYYTIDAGANVKVFFERKDYQTILEKIEQLWKHKIIKL